MFKDSLDKPTQRQDLTARELTEFVEAMRDDQLTDVQIAGFLVALLMKGPTVDEVAAIARAMRDNCVQIQPEVDGNLTDMLTDSGGAGLDEISPLGPTSIAEVKGDAVEHYTILPEDFGRTTAAFEDIKGGDPAYNAEVIRNILEGRDQGPRRDFLVLNNAFALYVGGAAKSPEEGIRLAQETIDSGAASRKLAEFVEASRAIAPPAA